LSEKSATLFSLFYRVNYQSQQKDVNAMVWSVNCKFRKLFFLSFFLFFSLCSVIGQTFNLPSETVSLGQGNNIIVGSVTGPNGERIETRIKVKISTMTRGDVITVTNENGNFAFRGLGSGNYTIIIDGEKEYEPVNQPVDIIQMRGGPGGTYNVNIRLTPKKTLEGKPGVVNSEFANVPKNALDFYNKGLELAQKGEYQGAIKELQNAVTEYPEFMLAHNEIGVQYLRLNDLEKADEAFQTALKIKPESFTPLMNRGIVLVQSKRFEEAEKVLRSIVKMKEKFAAGHYFLGQAVANLGKFDEAEKELTLAIELGGEEMKEAHRILAIIYSAKGQKKKAAAELKTYLKLTPTAPDAEQLKRTITQLEASNE
jgi:Flp pilus assembly protein TadD